MSQQRSPVEPGLDYDPDTVAASGMDPYERELWNLSHTPAPQRPSDDEQARIAYSRLAHMMGPEPAAPYQSSRLEKIGAAIQDVGSGLGMIWQGAHPVMGSGQHGKYFNPNRVHPTNAIGALHASDLAEQSRYDQDMSRRGLIMAQMFPSYMRQSEAEDPEERYLKLRLGAASALYAGKSRENVADIRARKKSASEDLAWMFFDDNGEVIPRSTATVPSPEGDAADLAFKHRYAAINGTTDPDELEAQLRIARGHAAAGYYPQAVARFGSGAAGSARASETNKGLAEGTLPGMNIAQTHDYYERRKAFVQSSIAAYWANPINQLHLSSKDPAVVQAVHDGAIKLEQELSDQYDATHLGTSLPSGHVPGSRTGALPPGETSGDRAASLATGHAAPKAAGGAPPPGGPGERLKQRDSVIYTVRKLKAAYAADDLNAMVTILKEWNFKPEEFLYDTDPDGQIVRKRTDEEALRVARAAVKGTLKSIAEAVRAQQGQQGLPITPQRGQP